MAHWREHTGLPVEASPHWLRHTLAKRIIARSTARNPLGVVQHALGHHSLNSTGIYTAPDRDELARALEEAA
jgi:site-specific recombinase XerC